MNPEPVTDVGEGTLRDWFAGVALQGLMSHGQPADEETVDRAYQIADLMLKRRAE